MPRGKKKTEEDVNKQVEEKAVEIEKSAKYKSRKSTGTRKQNKNLKPLGTRPKSERSEIARKGGIASGEAKRKKKELRELTKSFLEQDAVGAVKANLQRLGFDAEDMTNLAAILGVLFSKVLNSGDLNAARTIIEWAGMAPMQQIQETEAMQKLNVILGADDEKTEEETVVFYLPENGRDNYMERSSYVESTGEVVEK